MLQNVPAQVPPAAFAWPEPVPVVFSAPEWAMMRDQARDDDVLLATIFVSEKAMMRYWPRMRHLMRAMSPFGVRFAVVEVRDDYFTRYWGCDVPLWHDLASPRNAWCTVDADVMIAKLALGCGDRFHNIPSERPATAT